MWEKRNAWKVTAFFVEEDSEGEPVWFGDNNSDDFFADSYEEAVKLKEKLLAGEDPFYGDLVEDVYISDEPEEHEFLVPDKKEPEKEASMDDEKIKEDSAQVPDVKSPGITSKTELAYSKSSIQSINQSDKSVNQEKEEFLKSLDRYYKGEMGKNEFIYVGKTPYFMKELGAEMIDVAIKQSTLKKCIREPKGSISAHSLSKEMIESIYDQLYHPVFIVNEMKRNSYALISDYIDANNNPMLLALSLKSTLYGVEVNEIKSFYGRSNLEIYLTQKHTPDEVYIFDNEKAKSLSRFLRLQLPTALKVLDCSDICKNILQQDKFPVNHKIEKDLTNNGFVPTKSLVEKMEKLNQVTGTEHSISDINKIYRSFDNEEVHNLVNDIADECRSQEQEQDKIHVESVNTDNLPE